MFSVEQRIKAFDTDYIVGVVFREKRGKLALLTLVLMRLELLLVASDWLTFIFQEII